MKEFFENPEFSIEFLNYFMDCFESINNLICFIWFLLGILLGASIIILFDYLLDRISRHKREKSLEGDSDELASRPK